MTTNTALSLDIQLFADGEGSAETAQNSGENIAVDAEQQTNAEGADEQNIHSAQTTSEEADDEERKAEFERLIKEEYKDLFTEKTQSIINKRFRRAKQQEEKLEKIQPLMELLGERYGADTADIDSLLQAVKADETYLNEQADKLGMTVEQFKHMRSLERENERLRRDGEKREEAAFANAVYANWLSQAQETAEVYPDFDLRAESENDNFTMLLKAGIPIKTAYEVVHQNDIISGAVQAAKQAAVNEIQTSSLRPGDGSVSAAGIVGKKDISALTTSEMEEIERRVLRGERISF